MKSEELLDALKDIIQRAETEEGYLEGFFMDDVIDLIEGIEE